MFWADRVASELKTRGKPLEWVDDMKTPSGKIHVGSLRGVVVHDLLYKALKDLKVQTKYTYVFEDHDPMDSLPTYLDKDKYEKYMGFPLFKIPSPKSGYKNFAEYYAKDFEETFRKIGCSPEILWTSKLYLSGKMNESIKLCLNKASVIRKIYEEMYKKKMPSDWYPFQVYCPSCGKVSTTRVTSWDGEKVGFECRVDGLSWVKGCGEKGEISPFSPNEKGEISGKLPWKVEWPVKWKVIGVTVEGAGKDHMSKGGSHDIAKLICDRVLFYEVPYSIAYEFFLVGGKKMSSSKGLGSAASSMLEILPPEILRFLMVKTKINHQIDFDPEGGTIPKLFDEYQAAAKAYFEKSDADLGRIFELSQVDGVKEPPEIRFSTLAYLIQMPGSDEKIKEAGAENWVPYAKIWLEKYARESDKFEVQKDIPEGVESFSKVQKEFLKQVAYSLDNEWDEENLEVTIYDTAKSLKLKTKEAFSAIYLSLLGKPFGPKAASLLLSLEKDFVKKRFLSV